MKCKYYGRYVDDAAIVSADKDWLKCLVQKIQTFLNDELGLELHMGKLTFSEIHQGVEFLGKYILPYRIYISNHSLNRIVKKIESFDYSKPNKIIRSVNSYLGIMSHTNEYKLSRKLFFTSEILRIGAFDANMSKMIDRRKATTKYKKQLKNSENYEQQVLRIEDGVLPY